MRRGSDVDASIDRGRKSVFEACLDDDAISNGGCGHEREDGEWRCGAATTGEGGGMEDGE